MSTTTPASGIPRVGDPLPDIVLPRLDGGGEIAFHALRGKRSLLFFWGSW